MSKRAILLMNIVKHVRRSLPRHMHIECRLRSMGTNLGSGLKYNRLSTEKVKKTNILLNVFGNGNQTGRTRTAKIVWSQLCRKDLQPSIVLVELYWILYKTILATTSGARLSATWPPALNKRLTELWSCLEVWV